MTYEEFDEDQVENEDEDEQSVYKKRNNRYRPSTNEWETQDYIKFIEDFQKKWSGHRKMRGPYKRR